MLFPSAAADPSLTISLQPQSITVGAAGTVVAADRGGRLFSVYRGGHTFRRGLNGRVLHKWRDGRGRHWESLDPGAADVLVDEAAATFARARRSLQSRPVGMTEPSTPAREPRAAQWDEAAAALERAAAFDANAARADAARFATIYAPVGILPPDHYLSLVLQATQGCSFNTCTFCDLYHEPYRVRTVEEFARHVSAVRDWLGPSLSLRSRAVFLGAANALAVPTSRLLPMLDVIADGMAPAGGIHAFVDGFTGALKGADDYRALAARGLRRVYLGLESGHDPLLAFVRKPANRDAVVATAAAIDAAGVKRAVIVMVGLGGDGFADGHVADTVLALNAMHLAQGDLIYLSDLVEVPATAYPTLASGAGLRPLTAEERRDQRDAILRGLRFDGRPPKIARYDVREFVY